MNGPDLDNLKQWVKARRQELDLTHLEIQQLGGPSTTTMTKIEAGGGSGPRRDVVHKLEFALKWKKGSVRDVLNGGEPRPEAADDADAAEDAELRRALRAALAAGRTPAEIHDLVDTEIA